MSIIGPRQPIGSHTRLGVGNLGLRGFPRLDRQDPINAGLSGYWSMDGGTISGTALSDLSGSGNNGTLVGGPTLVQGPFGQALSFDGSTQWNTLGNASNLQLSIGTVCIWLKTSGAGSSFRGVFVKENAWGMFLGGNVAPDNVLSLYDWGGGGGNQVSTSGSLADGKWHLVALTFQSGVTNGTTFWLDGLALNSVTFTVSNQGVGAFVAASNNGGGGPGGQAFAGSLKGGRVYNRILSAAEIWRLYSDQSGNLGLIVPTRRIVGGSAPPPSTTFSPVIGGGIGGAPGWIL